MTRHKHNVVILVVDQNIADLMLSVGQNIVELILVSGQTIAGQSPGGSLARRGFGTGRCITAPARKAALQIGHL